MSQTSYAARSLDRADSERKRVLASKIEIALRYETSPSYRRKLETTLAYLKRAVD